MLPLVVAKLDGEFGVEHVGFGIIGGRGREAQLGEAAADGGNARVACALLDEVAILDRVGAGLGLFGAQLGQRLLHGDIGRMGGVQALEIVRGEGRVGHHPDGLGRRHPGWLQVMVARQQGGVELAARGVVRIAQGRRRQIDVEACHGGLIVFRKRSVKGGKPGGQIGLRLEAVGTRGGEQFQNVLAALRQLAVLEPDRAIGLGFILRQQGIARGGKHVQRRAVGGELGIDGGGSGVRGGCTRQRNAAQRGKLRGNIGEVAHAEPGIGLGVSGIDDLYLAAGGFLRRLVAHEERIVLGVAEETAVPVLGTITEAAEKLLEEIRLVLHGLRTREGRSAQQDTRYQRHHARFDKRLHRNSHLHRTVPDLLTASAGQNVKSHSIASQLRLGINR